MKKAPQKSARRGGISTSGSLHKAITVRYYTTNRTHLLAIKKKDAEWLGLESGEELTINFHRHGKVCEEAEEE